MASRTNADESVKTAIEFLVPHFASGGIVPGVVDWAERKIVQWDDGAKETSLEPAVYEWIDIARKSCDLGTKLVEAMRKSAQNNPAFCGKNSLVASMQGMVSDRMKLAEATCNFSKDCLGNQPTLIQYVGQFIELEKEIDQRHELFLKQVDFYSAKPIADISTKFYPNMLEAYKLLIVSRKRYDKSRRKREQKAIERFRNEFAEREHDLRKFLVEMPRQQVAIVGALDCYRRAERDLRKATQDLERQFSSG